MTTTTIQVDLEVRDELRSRGRMGETYNDVVRRLLNATRNQDRAGHDPGRRSLPFATRPEITEPDRI